MYFNVKCDEIHTSHWDRNSKMVKVDTFFGLR